jgi:hypothetical protein
MVQEGSPWLFAGTGTGKILHHGDGDGGLFPDGEFPVAIFSHREHGYIKGIILKLH